MAKSPMPLLPLLALLFANTVGATTATTTTATATVTAANARLEMAILWVKPSASLNNGNTYRIYSAASDDYFLLGNTIPNAFPPPSTGAGANQTHHRRLVTDADRYLPPGTYLVELTQPLPVDVGLYARCAIPHPTTFTATDFDTTAPFSPAGFGCRSARVIFTRPGEPRKVLYTGSVILEFKKAAAPSTTTNDRFHVKFNVAQEHQGIDNQTGSQKFTTAHEKSYGATIKFTKLK